MNKGTTKYQKKDSGASDYFYVWLYTAQSVSVKSWEKTVHEWSSGILD